RSHCYLHAFPTRRSSDLPLVLGTGLLAEVGHGSRTDKPYVSHPGRDRTLPRKVRGTLRKCPVSSGVRYIRFVCPGTICITPEETGHFQGKCAELCGEYHSEMLFNVEIVEEDEFLDEIRQLPEGLSGAELNRNPNENPDGQQDQEVPLGDPQRIEE